MQIYQSIETSYPNSYAFRRRVPRIIATFPQSKPADLLLVINWLVNLKKKIEQRIRNGLYVFVGTAQRYVTVDSNF
jgi:hypothetical protein